MKDHEIAQLVNDLRDIAKEFHAAQQLRERIAIRVRAALANDTTQREAGRYRWLRKADPYSLLGIAWGKSKAACAIGADCDAAIDAAMRDGH